MMSKRAEENTLRAEKERNMIAGIEPEMTAFVKALQEKTGLAIFAQIEPIGAPQIKVTFFDGRIPARKKGIFLKETKKAYQKRLDSMKKDFVNQINDKINELGIMLQPQITPFGANIFFVLNNKKREELFPVITPITNPVIIPGEQNGNPEL